MLYKALDNGLVWYDGNNINNGCEIDPKAFNESYLTNRVSRIHNEKMFSHIANIDSGIFFAAVQYFQKIGAKWANVPLTTLMISSPGEVYAGQILDYTTDALPIEIPEWFGNKRRIFLAESSQFYLELNLLIQGLDQVFSIYNSFRKEKSDATHLTEFQHIEYEGKIDLEQNINIFIELFNYIWFYLVEHNKNDILFFISEEELLFKNDLIKKGPIRLSFSEALNILYNATNNEKYKKFSLEHFGTWEEVKLTEILGGNVVIEKFPMLQIPFYHAISSEEINGVPLAKNADFILHGFRETIGAGERIKDKEALIKKADIFNLPKEDYLPYVTSRDYNGHTITSGFGLGWQRLTQWITNQPYIYESTIFPRTHFIPNP